MGYTMPQDAELDQDDHIYRFFEKEYSTLSYKHGPNG